MQNKYRKINIATKKSITEGKFGAKTRHYRCFCLLKFVIEFFQIGSIHAEKR